MTIRFTPEAEAELEDVLDYVRGQSPAGASRLGERIRQVLTYLSHFPHTGTLTSLQPMRRVALNPYPYLIFYLPQDNEIVVVGIRHSARKPSSMPDQL